MDGGIIRRELQTTLIPRRDKELSESPAVSNPREGRGGPWSTWPRWLWAPLAVGAFLVIWYTLVARPGVFAHDAFINVLFIAITGTAGTLCLSVARRGGPDRWVWIFLGLGCFASTIGSIIWSTYQIVWRVPLPYPSLADVGYLALFPLFAIGLAFLIRANTPNVLSMEVVLDSLIVVAASGIIVFDFVIAPHFAADSEPLPVLVTSLLNAGFTFVSSSSR